MSIETSGYSGKGDRLHDFLYFETHQRFNEINGPQSIEKHNYLVHVPHTNSDGKFTVRHMHLTKREDEYLIIEQYWIDLTKYVMGLDFSTDQLIIKVLNTETKSSEFEKITGWRTHEEMSAYEKGREHEEMSMFKFVKNWNGSTNSVFGQLLAEKMEQINNKICTCLGLHKSDECYKLGCKVHRETNKRDGEED